MASLVRHHWQPWSTSPFFENALLQKGQNDVSAGLVQNGNNVGDRTTLGEKERADSERSLGLLIGCSELICRGQFYHFKFKPFAPVVHCQEYRHATGGLLPFAAGEG